MFLNCSKGKDQNIIAWYLINHNQPIYQGGKKKHLTWLKAVISNGTPYSCSIVSGNQTLAEET